MKQWDVEPNTTLVPDYSNYSRVIIDTAINLTLSYNDTTTPAPTLTPEEATLNYLAIYAASFLIVFCTISLVVNIVILSSVCFLRQRVHSTLYISLSLAAADTVSLAFFALGLFIFTLLPRFDVSVNAPCVLILIEALREGSVLTTMFHLAALAVNHYIGILLPLHYPVYMTRRNMQYLTLLLWTVPSSIIVIYMFLIEGDGFQNCPYVFLTKAKYRVRFSILFFSTLAMMIFIYTHIYMLVCKHQKRPLDGLGRRSTKRVRKESSESRNQVNKRAIITTLMILGSTILGWLPSFTYFALCCQDCLLSKYWQKRTIGEFIVLFIVNFLLIFKTATNSYIYAFRMKEIKKALRKMGRRVMLCICASATHWENSTSADYPGGVSRFGSRSTRVPRYQPSFKDNGALKEISYPTAMPSSTQCILSNTSV